MDAHDVTITHHQVNPGDDAREAHGVIERLGLELRWTARRATPTAPWDITLPSEPLPAGESWDLYDVVGDGPNPKARIIAALGSLD